MASMAAKEIEMLEPWRKNFPLCKPYTAHDKADAVRFLRELEEGCNGTDADADWTLGTSFVVSIVAVPSSSAWIHQHWSVSCSLKSFRRASQPSQARPSCRTSGRGRCRQ